MTQTSTQVWQRRLLILTFVWIVPMVLLLDSRLLLDAGLNGQILSNVIGPLYLLLIVSKLSPAQRLTVLIFVPVAVIAENIFSLIFRLYIYKFDAVPGYVPFGHAILLGTGILIAESTFVQRHQRSLQIGLLVMHALVLLIILALGDTLSLVFEAGFVVILYRKRAQFLYLFMGIMVLYVELIGTAVGCWVWLPTAFGGVLHTTNPPLGAFACYVIGDILAIKVAHWLTPFLRPLSIRLPFTANLAAWVGLAARDPLLPPS